MMAAFFFGTGLALAAAGFASSPLTLALTLAAAGLFAAIYHPIGTAMLVEAAGDRVGRAIGVNGVFGNFGVALAPVVTAFLAQEIGWRAAFVVPGLICFGLGAAWLVQPPHDAAPPNAARPLPQIPPAPLPPAGPLLLPIPGVSRPLFKPFPILVPELVAEG